MKKYLYTEAADKNFMLPSSEMTDQFLSQRESRKPGVQPSEHHEGWFPVAVSWFLAEFHLSHRDI